MNQPTIVFDSPPRNPYPPPPNVHWGVLLLAQFLISIAAAILFSREYANMFANLAFGCWAIYICLWLRKLNPQSMSLYLCGTVVILQVIFSLSFSPQDKDVTTGLATLTLALLIAYLVIWIAAIYTIRSELHAHYNRVEPIGLYLGPVMTFFFSFLYFQYHLKKIAELRERYGDRPFNYQSATPLA